MTSAKATKRALISSVISLLLCFSMLLGTTFAWFTDTAVSAGNKIQAGKLDVELYQWTGATDSTEISKNQDPVFDGNILWEPGKTQVVYLSIKNAGNLALKYRVALDVTNLSDDSLTDVMVYEITPDAKYGDVKSWAGPGTSVVPGTNSAAEDVPMEPGDEHFFALSVHMDENAGNKYMGESISFDIRVLAGQQVHEEDSFGPNYDKLAGYPGRGYADPITGNTSAAEIQIRDENSTKVGSVVIPKDAAAPGEKLTADVVDVTNDPNAYYEGNFTIAAGMTVTQYDVSVDGLKDGNTTPVKVQLRIAAGLNPATVKLYHYDEPVICTYDPSSGYVTFETATFSPFTIVYNADPYEAPDVNLPEGMPTAKVEPFTDTDNITWGSYGQWSPTAGLEANLEAAYTFSCTENLDAAKQNVYADWYCDFYVMLNKDLGANQIFLGGNYGSFGWVGFHNGELTLDANTELGLLESVTTNPWTYVQVVQNVGEFICGVGDVDDALSGATFTVMLRLTNPNDATEFYNVATIEYTFE